MFQLRCDFIQLREDLTALMRENEELARENAILRETVSSNFLSPFRAGCDMIHGGQEEEAFCKPSPHASADDLGPDFIISSMFSVQKDNDENTASAGGVCISGGTLGMSVSENILLNLKHSQAEVSQLKSELEKERKRAEEQSKAEDTAPLRRSYSLKSSGSSPRSRLVGPLERVSRLGRILKAYVNEEEV
jgi:regulator of replication initiation timing